VAALYIKIFAERNCGASELGRDVRKAWHVSELRGGPDLDRAALRATLKASPPRERAGLHNQMLDMEHDRILYSDFGWSASAPSLDIIQSAAHATETLFVGLTAHPVAFAAALMDKPRTPGAATKEVPLLDWLNQPFPVHRRDGLDDETALLPLTLWSLKARAILNLAETDRTVLLLRTTDSSADMQAALNPHLIGKDGATPSFAKIEMPPWEQALRHLPASDLRDLRAQLDDGVLRALGYDHL